MLGALQLPPSIANICLPPDDPKFLAEHGIIRDTDIIDAAINNLVRIPDSYSIKEQLSSVKDQGDAPNCASFAQIASLEHLIKNDPRSPVPSIDLSEAHLIHTTHKNFGDCKSGLPMGAIFTIMIYNGVVHETLWPYDSSTICWSSPKPVKKKARYALPDPAKYLGIRSIEEVIQIMKEDDYQFGKGSALEERKSFSNLTKIDLLKKKSPVIVSLPVFWSADGVDAGWESGHVKMPSRDQIRAWLDGQAEGSAYRSEGKAWHAIPICALDERNRSFQFKNSWGAWWGQRGYGTVPYEYIDRYAREVWGANPGPYRILRRAPDAGI